VAHPLDSARHRLERADENIRNLTAEIAEFLAPFPRVRLDGVNPVISDENRRKFEVIRKQALSGTAWPRFSVLAGEIVHHLRCAFDHVIWQLSTPAAQNVIPQRY
jgi:hypothetical protein